MKFVAFSSDLHEVLMYYACASGLSWPYVGVTLVDLQRRFATHVFRTNLQICYTCCKFLNRFQKLATRCSTANSAKNRPQRGVTLERFFAQHRIIANRRCKSTCVTPPLDTCEREIQSSELSLEKSHPTSSDPGDTAKIRI